MAASDYIRRRVENNEAYIISEKKSISADGTFNIHIRNPDNNGIALIIHEVKASTKGEATLTLYDNFDSITDGTDITVQNANMDSDNGSPDEGPMEVYQDSTFTAAAEADHAGDVIGAAGGGSNALGGRGDFPVSRMEEGRNMVIEVHNDSSSAFDAAITILLTE